MNKLILVAAVLGSWAMVSARYIDDEYAKVEELAETNKGMKDQISRAGTIGKLVAHLSSMDCSHQVHNCSSKYLELLKDFNEVIEMANDDVCGEQKLALLENFHRKYVSSKHIKGQRRSNKVPKLIELFFMHYANEISILCEQSAQKSLAESQHPTKRDDLDEVERMRQFTDLLKMTNKDYNGTYLLWNMVDSLDLDKQDKFFKYMSIDDDVRLNMQMEDVQPMVADCRHELDEFLHSKTHFPVLRPNEMGNYPHGTHLIDLSELYIAVGVPGAIQHLSEMKDYKKTMEPIEQDPEVLIFQKADLSLKANFFGAFLELIEKI